MQKKKTEIITAKMTPADKQAIHQRAKAAGMTVTDYLTTCALGKEIVRVDGLDDLLSELKAQGRNLNQLTTLANMGRISVLRGDSWKLDLIQAINEALEYADNRESFIENMEVEGYEVSWFPIRKHITFTCPNGRKCRDSSLHDKTFLKENLEAPFAYCQATGFRPQTPEPDEGWLGELASNWLRVIADLERDTSQPIPVPPTWTDSKQRRREALKKLAMGQKFGGDQHYEQTM